MRRLTLPEGALDRDGPVRLPPEAVHYVQRVLRLAVSDRVELTDGAKYEAEGRLARMSKDAVEVELHLRRPLPRPSPPRLRLLQAVGKAEKMDQVVRQAAELGACRLTPVVTARTVALRKAAQPRWARIAEDALRVAGGHRMAVDAPMELAAALAQVPAGWYLDRSGARTLREMMARPAPSALALAVGPEGGWSPEERTELEGRGWVGVSLGSRNLRTETAGPAALAALELAGFETDGAS